MKKISSYPVYLIISGLHGVFFALVTTINLVYQATVVGLNPLQLVLVGTVLEASFFLLETPTGIVADVYSRRRSVIIGYALVGLGFIVEGAFPSFETVLIAQVIWGGGYTFISGAKEAWIADEVGDDLAGKVFLRGAQVGQIGSLIGMGFSVVLASIQINLPIILGGVLYIGLACFLMFVMTEHAFTPLPRAERNSWQAMGHTFMSGVSLIRKRPMLLTIFIIAGIYGMFSEGFDRLWTPHMLGDFEFPDFGQFKPVVWFGLMSAVSMILSMLFTEIARRRIDTTQHHTVVRALLFLNATISGAVIAFALTGDFVLALIAYWIVMPVRRVYGPLYQAWLNQRLTANVRATVLSMGNQMDALGQIAGGPLLGWIGTVFSIRSAITTAGVILLFVLPFYLTLSRRKYNEQNGISNRL